MKSNRVVINSRQGCSRHGGERERSEAATAVARSVPGLRVPPGAPPGGGLGAGGGQGWRQQRRGDEARGLGRDADLDAAGRGCAMLPLCHAGRVAHGAQGPRVPASARGGGRC